MLGRGERLRLSAAVAAVALAACVAAGTALATGSKERVTALSGASQWSSGYAIAGTYDGGLGRGTYAGTLVTAGASFTSSTCGPVCAPLAGRITFSGRTGTLTAAVQPGSVVSMEDIASHSFRDFRVQLRISGGTGRYAHTRGRLGLTYSSIWTHEWVNGVYVDGIADAGTLTGTIR